MNIKRLLKKVIPNRTLQRLRMQIWKFTYHDTIQHYKKGIKSCSTWKDGAMKVAIIVQYPEMWNSISPVYEELKNRNDVEVKVIAVPKNVGKDGVYQPADQNEAYDFFQAQGIEVVNAYEETWFDLQAYNPDYTLYIRGYNSDYPSMYWITEVCCYSKVCYIPYAFNMVDGEVFHVTYKVELMLSAYRVFCPNQSRYLMCKKYFGDQGSFMKNKFQFMGYPRFDLILNQDFDAKNERKVVLWTPRWVTTVESNKKSHFKEYHRDFLEFVKSNPQYDFIVRPHPKMFDTLVKTNTMTQEEIDCYLDVCKNVENFWWDTEKDYLKTLKKADVVITDYSSLLVEDLLANKKVIYCDNSKGLNEEGKLICNALYSATTFDDVKANVVSLLNGNDTMIDVRKQAIRKLVPTQGEAIGKVIVDCIMDDYQMSKC